jgi:RimJ/RimL family protein N-acetyltransferase
MEDIYLRKFESKDVEALYQFKNDPDIRQLLVGFSMGMSLDDIRSWIDFHNGHKSEFLRCIATRSGDQCIGHIGLYEIDHRAGQAGFGVCLDPKYLGQGIGKSMTKKILAYGFTELNLHRIHLTVLENNIPARRLYEKLGFKEEGLLREAQFKKGEYLNVCAMSILRSEWKTTQP